MPEWEPAGAKDEVGIPRLVGYLSQSLQLSEETALRKGTEYVEYEEETINMISEIAGLFGGDLDDPQWYAGVASTLSAMASLAHGNMMGEIVLNPLTGMLSNVLGRIYDRQVKEGAKIFDVQA